MNTDRYRRIDDYALLGDGEGTALVARDGSIDWLAAPKLDCAPFLAGMLDADRGGHFALAPVAEHQVRRRYVPGTLALETTFETASGILRVTDLMTQGFQGRLPWTELVRQLEAEGAPQRVRWELEPGSRLSTVRPWPHRRDGIPFVLSGDLLAAVVHERMGEAEVDEDGISGEVEVLPGEPALLALLLAQDKPLHIPGTDDIRRRVEHTVQGWQEWTRLLRLPGQHDHHVARSALTIKALSSATSGAIAAAPTTSLPEVVGGERNFDYRYAWVRDASFMIDALSRLGLSEEVDAALSWLLRAVQETAPDLHVFYTLAGEPAGAEQWEPALVEGYRGSDPVTVGNKAAGQTQHGSYGDLFGAVARHVRHGCRLDTETGLTLAKLADKLCDEWPKPDAGLWELGDYRQYTSSLVNSWNALDCAVALAEGGELPDFHVDRWELERHAIRRFVDDHCWSDAKQSYTFYAGSDELDAAVLLAARCGFLAPDDPRLVTTIDAVRRELSAGGPLLYRYSGAAKQENAFVACTFWMIEALAIAGRSEEASDLLDTALTCANDLGLWGEEIDPVDGSHRGNFPIGISHLAVVGAITAVARSRQER